MNYLENEDPVHLVQKSNKGLSSVMTRGYDGFRSIVSFQGKHNLRKSEMIEVDEFPPFLPLTLPEGEYTVREEILYIRNEEFTYVLTDESYSRYATPVPKSDREIPVTSPHAESIFNHTIKKLYRPEEFYKGMVAYQLYGSGFKYLKSAMWSKVRKLNLTLPDWVPLVKYDEEQSKFVEYLLRCQE